MRFSDPRLLLAAVIHSSYAHEHADQKLVDNERLEFLGDAVLELVSADLLFRRNTAAREGTLTLDRAAMVSTGALAKVARRIDLGAHLRVGKGVEKSGGRELDSLLGNALEAVFGAVYLDQGLERARALFKNLALGAEQGPVNFKGLLQEMTQGKLPRGAASEDLPIASATPDYAVIESEGPSHRRRWRVEALLHGRRLATGEGRTRRAAEQEAARAAIEKMTS
jgi:ribonuclease-3